MQISFHVCFQKKRFFCWEHVLNKILSDLFIFVFFSFCICGFLDFNNAKFSWFLVFIFFIYGYLILLKFAFIFLVLNFYFMLLPSHNFIFSEKRCSSQISHSCSEYQFLMTSFKKRAFGCLCFSLFFDDGKGH